MEPMDRISSSCGDSAAIMSRAGDCCNNGNPATGGFKLCSQVTSEFEFFYAISVFTTRPHILSRLVKGAELLVEDPDPESCPKFDSLRNEAGGVREIAVPFDIVESLKEPFLKFTIDELRDLEVDRFTLTRTLLGRSLREYRSREIWSLSQHIVEIESSHDEPNKEVPPFKIVCSLIKSCPDGLHMSIEIIPKVLGNAIVDQSVEIYQNKIVPRILKWASSTNSLNQESNANKAPGVPSTSLKYVPVKPYYEEYKKLKDLYFGRLLELWTETTDPLKFISEELSIAAYINTFIRHHMPDTDYSFVDMGCGNGVLTFSLTAVGARGFGIDIRSRKLWDIFPQLGVAADLRVQSFNPFSDTIEVQRNLWLIGNHADELTPWIPVLSRRFGAYGFIVIPCCLFDFHGKFQRKAKNCGDVESLYQNYIHYICQVGSKCGYVVKVDKLRIPSTKRICLIGTSLPKDHPHFTNLSMEADAYVSSKISDFPSTDNSIQDIKVFKPRNPIERINNLSQIDRSVVNGIVSRLFSSLLQGSSNLVSHPQYVRKWNCGRIDLALSEAASILTREEKDAIQKQGKGIQTLIKNNNQVFRIAEGCVMLRRPIIDDVVKRPDKANLKIKTTDCYFYNYHPDGCPLTDDLCRFKH